MLSDVADFVVIPGGRANVSFLFSIILVAASGSLIKNSKQTLFIRFHSANRMNRKRPFTASLYIYATALRRATFFQRSELDV